MAAIDLELRLERGSQGWGQERQEMMDNFDLEMQEWEDQLQDIQRKIEELYNEVQARRGANDIPGDDQKHCVPLESGLMHHRDSLFGLGHCSRNHPRDIFIHPYGPNGCSHPASHQLGFDYCHSSDVSEIGVLLQDYLVKGKKMSQKNNGDRHVHFSDVVKMNQDISAYQDKGGSRSGNNLPQQEPYTGSFEESENRKNRVSHMKISSIKDNTVAKPPVGQRDASALQARLQFPATTAPSLDRKSFGQGVLGDRKCHSPSVLKKFGAMLQENEGKLLTKSGVVTHQGPEEKCSTPGCQRRALGVIGGASKVPMRVPNQKCQADSDMLTAEIEPGQEWGSELDCRHGYKEQRGGYSSSKGSQSVPQQVQRRSQVPGSPKIKPRGNSGEKARKSSLHQVESKLDCRTSDVSSRAQRIQRGQELSSCNRLKDEGLMELLDMLEIQHEYSSGPRTGFTAYKQETEQINPDELSSTKLKKSFSRPARPANQRPPSRWASRTPTARITALSGPIYHPPSPMTHSPSPARKHRPLFFYSLQTETVIM